MEAVPDGLEGSAGFCLPALDDLVEVGVAGEEDDEAVGDRGGELEETGSESVDCGGRVAFVVCEVEIEAAGSFGDGEHDEVFLGDYVTAAEGFQASGVNVREKMAGVVVHLR